MPKRRLAYAEVLSETPAQSPSQRSRAAPSRTSSASTQRATSQRKSCDIILSLSHSCNQHAEFHQNQKATGSLDDAEEQWPGSCRNAMNALRNLLPKVEKILRPPVPGKKGPEAQDVAHLCDFYNSTLRGDYCPYAPSLFEGGNSPKDVLCRVVYLFQHLVSPVVVAAAKKEAFFDESKEASQTVLRTLSHTIADLLSFLVDSALQYYIVRDLVNLVEDCALVVEGNMLPIELSLFEETRRACSVEMDCTLANIRQSDQIWTLQTAGFLALNAFLQALQERRKNGGAFESAYRDSSLLPSGIADVVYTPDLIQGDMMATLLGILRHVLLLGQPKKFSHSLWIHRKIAATKILTQVLVDWRLVSVPESLFVESAITIARAAQAVLIDKSKEIPEYVAAIATLLRLSVINSTLRKDPLSQWQTQMVADATSLPVLLDCICIVDGRDSHRRNELDVMVLRTVHFLLQATSTSKAVAADFVAYCLSHGIVTHLVNLLNDAKLSNHVSSILVGMLPKLLKPRELNSLCRAAIDVSRKCDAKTCAEADRSATQVSALKQNETGSKRKREQAGAPTPLKNLDLSPTKRTGKKKSGSASNNNNNGRVQSFNTALRDLYKCSHDASRRIGNIFVPLNEAHKAVNTEKSKNDSLGDISMVASTLTFTVRTIRAYYSENVEVETIAHLLMSEQKLASALEGLSFGLCESDLTTFDMQKSRMAQLVVDCALVLHFSVGPLIGKVQHGCTDAIVNLLNSGACLARRLCVVDDSYTSMGTCISHQIMCSCSTKYLPGPFSNESRDDRNQDCRLSVNGCFVAFLRDVVSASDETVCGYKEALSLAYAQGLRVGARCCLLAALYPKKCSYVRQMERTTKPPLADSDTLDVFVKMLRTSEVESSEFIGQATALAFIPVLLSSHARLAEKSGSDGTFSSLLLKFVESCLFPFIYDFKIHDANLCRMLLGAIGRVQTIATSSATEVSERYNRSNPYALMNDLFGSHGTKFGRCGPNSLSLQLEIRMREIVRIVADKVPKDHEDFCIRIMRWSCLSNSIIRWSTTEIREHSTLRKNSMEEDGPEQERNLGDFRSQSWLSWVIEAAFLDDDEKVREYVSRRLFKVVLADNDSFLLSHFSTNEEFQALTSYSRSIHSGKQSIHHGYDLEHAAEGVVSEFFREIDKMLNSSIGFSDSQLSFTMATMGSRESSSKTPQNPLLMQRSATRLLATFCHNANTRSPTGKIFYKKAFQRLVRIWAGQAAERNQIDALFPDMISTSSCKAMAFGELSRLSGQNPTELRLRLQASPQFTSTAIGDIAVLSCNASRENQFLQLEGFVRSIFLRNLNETVASYQVLQAVSSFVEGNLPVIAAQFIGEKDLELLQFAVAFRLFLGERVHRSKKSRTGHTKMIGKSNMPSRGKYSSTHMSVQGLRKKTKEMCMEPKIIERILPLLFMNTDRAGLSFFTKEVLKGMHLHDFMKQQELLVLKGLVWDLGRDPNHIGPAKMAIRTAAVARALDQACDGQELASDQILNPGVTLGMRWVTSQFMFLLVNVVQARWKARSLSDRLQAVRCLHTLLDFLVASESAQFFPQIMATINASVFDGDPKKWDNDSDLMDAASLRLYAVKSLSKFVRLVIEKNQLDAVATNLTGIVVTLIPVMDNPESCVVARSELLLTTETAVSLLEFMTSSELGASLAESFAEIPFLPAIPVLDIVHRSLRSLGVDFDNLIVLSAGTQHGGPMSKEVSTNEVSATMGSSDSGNAQRILALQKRLTLICGLLDNESTSIRKVALQHLTDLLRGNRNLFHSLVRTEGSFAGKHYLTVAHRTDGGGLKWASNGAVTAMMEKLLARCVAESDAETRLRLATCIGEVGAISETILGELTIGTSMGTEAIDSPTSSYKWRLDQPPWHSQAVKYELQLVTRHLVVAMKAASSTTDQHKISFAIQQLLRLLNRYGRQSEPQGKEAESSEGKATMTKWLKDNLDQSGVYEMIEPFFQSEFKMKSTYVTLKPPFFNISASYPVWMSNLCRWMIHNSTTSDLSPWKDFFFACRTIVRTEAGLNVSEFILPLLVLDRICFGASEDLLLIRQEFLDVLQMDSQVFMDSSDRQRAANIVFVTIDTLRVWSEREIEERSRGRPSVSSSGKGRRQATTKSNRETLAQSWPAEESIDKIGDLLKNLPLKLQSQAAAHLGMHARALLRLEMIAREHNAVRIFEKSADEQKRDTVAKSNASNFHCVGTPSLTLVDVDLMKTVLSRLDDCDTMVSIGQDSLFLNPLQQMKDSIREKQASNNFESAIQDYERALQATHNKDYDPELEMGSLGCLLELGRYESVLKQVRGLHMVHEKASNVEATTSFAVEAAWKLGRWEMLSDLVKDEKHRSKLSTENSNSYQIFVGHAMLGLKENTPRDVESAICSARKTVMHSLSSVATENYARSYSDITKLQSLRELENASEVFCQGGSDSKVNLEEIANSTAMDGWSWEGRVDTVSSRGASSIIITRVALARLYNEPVLEGSLFLNSGQRARKNKRGTIAENLLSQAQAAVARLPREDFLQNSKLFSLVYASQVQMAKLKYEAGESATALRILGQGSVEIAANEMMANIDKPEIISQLAVAHEKCLINELCGIQAALEEDSLLLTKRFASRLLQLTRWVSEVGLKGSGEIIARFKLVQKVAPDWEKGQFYFAKYVDSLLQSRLTALANRHSERESLKGVDEDAIRTQILVRDNTCQKHTLLAMQSYAAALKIDAKHVYQALPRLLSLWFDLVSIDASDKNETLQKELRDALLDNQNEANTFMASKIKDIPAVAFYTAMPQLISRVIHDNEETAMVVKSILQRVLIKFPQQAMWHLAWLKGSRDSARSTIGNDIFKSAQKMLAKNHRSLSNLLAVSQSLFRYLRELAVYQSSSGGRSHSNVLQIRSWHHEEVDLSEFVPPIQAALSVSPLSIEHGGSKDHFPRTLPRMRAFSSRIGVMSSKAKPKKLKAYAVPSNYKPTPSTRLPPPTPKGKASKTKQEDVDIGELHFLVKQEAKGDLRKDARVQDLNNVINRLMASDDSDAASNRRRRRLHLRTFAVTCLSEDIGILEWVPDTDSLRNLVSKSFNPQTSATCSRRRGTRIANFGDPTLRSHYEMCQNKYFKEGNLSKAATMFEDHCLRPYPPLLYWWFVQRFHDPHAWYEARNRFTLSAAAWSAVGHVIGLGDRHSENILVDTSSGECVHVDFDCIFDKGLNLPRPEVVPFRLTANMIDAFGPTGADGVYTAGLQTAMRTLRDNRDTLLSVLEPFLKDPVIDWKRQKSRSQQKGSSNTTTQDRQTREAKRSIQVIDERLHGIYNLRNPNLKKYRRTDRYADQDDELAHLVPLCVESQVKRMIQEATSHENLVQLYVGWMPWV